MVSSGSSINLPFSEAKISFIEPAHKSVRPMLPAKSVSPAKSCGAASVIFPALDGRNSETLPGVCPGV
jgi:hypothetical protein